MYANFLIILSKGILDLQVKFQLCALYSIQKYILNNENLHIVYIYIYGEREPLYIHWDLWRDEGDAIFFKSDFALLKKFSHEENWPFLVHAKYVVKMNP